MSNSYVEFINVFNFIYFALGMTNISHNISVNLPKYLSNKLSKSQDVT